MSLVSSLNEAASEYKRAKQRIAEEKAALKKAKRKLKHAEEAQVFVQDVAQKLQQQAHQQISVIVTRCLDLVFGKETFTFEIEFKQARGKTEARLNLMQNGEVLDPLEECSFGVLDVASFALRLAALVLHRPPLRRLMILDEPFRHLHMSDSKHREKVMELLSTLAEELGMQFILITNQTEFTDSGVGKVIRLEK